MGNEISKLEAYKSNISVEDILLELSRWGYPRLSKQKTGWYCKIEVTVTPKGVDFEVGSEFGLHNMQIAVEQCLERLKTAVKELSLEHKP